MPKFDPSGELLHQIVVPMSTDIEPTSDYTWPCLEELSNKLLYEVTVKLYNEQ